MKESKFKYQTPFLDKLEIIRYDIDTQKDIVLDLEIELIKGIDIEDTSGTQIGVNIKINLNHQENDNIPFKMDLVMMANFKWDEDTEEELIKVFLKHNAPTMLMSYARPLIYSTTSSTKYPGFELPFIDLTNL